MLHDLEGAPGERLFYFSETLQTGPMKTSIDLHQLVECVGDAIIVADVHEKIVLWNPAATRIFGYSEQEALGHTLDLIVPERQRQKHNEGYSHSMETGTTRYGTSLLKVPAKHKDGSMLSIAFTVGMLFDTAGKANGVVAIIRDETARFAEERALKKRLSDLENPQVQPYIVLQRRQYRLGWSLCPNIGHASIFPISRW